MRKVVRMMSQRREPVDAHVIADAEGGDPVLRDLELHAGHGLEPVHERERQEEDGRGQDEGEDLVRPLRVAGDEGVHDRPRHREQHQHGQDVERHRVPQQVGEDGHRAAQDEQGVAAHQPHLDGAHRAGHGGRRRRRPVDGPVDEAHVHAPPEDFFAAADDDARGEPVVDGVESVLVLEHPGHAAGGGVDARGDLREGEVEVVGRARCRSPRSRWRRWAASRHGGRHARPRSGAARAPRSAGCR